VTVSKLTTGNRFCFEAVAETSRPIHAVRPSDLDSFLAALPAPQSAYLSDIGFHARGGELALLPGADGVSAAVLGLGDDRSHAAFGDLAYRLPQGGWVLREGDYDTQAAVLGYCLGSYRFERFKPARRPAARLVLPDGCETSVIQAEAICRARDLVNLPANLLGPAELADAAAELAQRHGAAFERLVGDELAQDFPTVLAVGRGSERAPQVATLRWQGSQAGDDAPHIALCGKGVVFDSGGYDIKPSGAMLRMKKDMGGAASMLTLAEILIAADLPIRLTLRLGCVENSVSGSAMRPMDVIVTSSGLSVEVGNTDAEGRLVLCDLLTAASAEGPDLLIDAATLTGAARVALGPELPALFSNDTELARCLLDAGEACSDPLWQLPLWNGYDRWLDSNVADLANVSGKPHAGAIVAALFLRRFVGVGVKWIHIDTYAWNDSTRPAHPEGGDAPSVRALALAIEQWISGAFFQRMEVGNGVAT
jgi:leucyl aminopeptidase